MICTLDWLPLICEDDIPPLLEKTFSLVNYYQTDGEITVTSLTTCKHSKTTNMVYIFLAITQIWVNLLLLHLLLSGVTLLLDWVYVIHERQAQYLPLMMHILRLNTGKFTKITCPVYGQNLTCSLTSLGYNILSTATSNSKYFANTKIMFQA